MNSKHLAVVFLLLESYVFIDQQCPPGCLDNLPKNPYNVTCELVKITGQCIMPEMKEFCKCTCGDACRQQELKYILAPISAFDTNNDTSDALNMVSPARLEQIRQMEEDMNSYSVGRSVDVSDEVAFMQAGCDCFNEPPVGSTYTCTEMWLDDKCDVLIEYGFCECTCGKCTEGETELVRPSTEPVTAADSDVEQVGSTQYFTPVSVQYQRVAEFEQLLEVYQETFAPIQSSLQEYQSISIGNEQVNTTTSPQLLNQTDNTANEQVLKIEQQGDPNNTQEQNLTIISEDKDVLLNETIKEQQFDVVGSNIINNNTNVQSEYTSPPPPLYYEMPMGTLEASAYEAYPAATTPLVVTPSSTPLVITPNNMQTSQEVYSAYSTPNTCIDIEPPSIQMLCPELQKGGQCTQPWMQGFCEKSCGSCTVQNQVVDSSSEVGLDVVQSSLQSYPQTTSSLSQINLVQVEYEPQNAQCLRACNDNPPPKSEFTCRQQKTMDKCSRQWMKGYCECTCETCDAYFHMKQPFQQSTYNSTAEQQLGTSDFITPIWQPVNYTEDTEEYLLTILHFNDIHARVEPATDQWWECEPEQNLKGECFGGFARMKTVVDQERMTDPELLLLDGGDDFVGSQWDYHDPENKATAYFLSQMGVDAMTLGNHEFDHGPDTLIKHIEIATYAVLSCNMDASLKPGLDEITHKYAIKQVKGRQVGIIGLTTTYTNDAEAANPYPVWFNEPYQAARECVSQLQQQGVDIIIALSHLGYTADRYLVKEVSGLDLVIGAHSHSFLADFGDEGPELNKFSGERDASLGPYPTWEKNPDGQNIPVVQAGWATRYIGKIQIRFNSNGEVIAAQGKPILLGGSASENEVLEDQQFAQEIKNWKWWK